MDEKFTTSFIPKTSLTDVNKPRSSSTGFSFFALITIILFLIVLAGAAGTYFWKQYLINQIKTSEESIVRARSEFSPELIETLSILNKRIEAVKALLNDHVAASSIFATLEQSTLQNVYFKEFTYTNLDSKKITLAMKGEAASYSSVALQSDVFAKNKYIKNPIFSDLDLAQNGNVVFSFATSIDPALLSYSNKTSFDTASTVETPENVQGAPMQNIQNAPVENAQ